ncbi:hypothetical protein OH77DRAFT_724490 [Trametes cingulata]|nr:hypothetical protein OH77DRAFT_724490 [Trametes cingulata]
MSALQFASPPSPTASSNSSVSSISLLPPASAAASIVGPSGFCECQCECDSASASTHSIVSTSSSTASTPGPRTPTPTKTKRESSMILAGLNLLPEKARGVQRAGLGSASASMCGSVQTLPTVDEDAESRRRRRQSSGCPCDARSARQAQAHVSRYVCSRITVNRSSSITQKSYARTRRRLVRPCA